MINKRKSLSAEETPPDEDLDLSGDSVEEEDIGEDGESEEEGDEELLEGDSGVENNVSLKRKAEGEESGAGTKKLKTRDAHLYRAPTVKELNQLRETENLFHSNLFRLQIEEMLKEIQIKAKYQALLEQWVQDLKTTLDNMDSREYELSKRKWLKKLKVKYPLKQFPALPGMFTFLKPESVTITGSYASGCCLGPDATVDVKIHIPSECFGSRDYVNHRYHLKRALYMSHVAGELQKSELVQELHFLQNGGCPVLPLLEVKPAGKLGKHILVLLHFVPPPECFKLSRLLPEKNSVRPSWYFQESAPELKEGEMIGTPHYNSSIVRGLVMETSEEMCTKILQEHHNVRDGVLLLKVWLRQRGLDQGHGSFSGYIMTMFVLYLLQCRHINTAMSSYQVARNVWNTIAQSDWTLEGISLSPTGSVADFHCHFDVVFLDATGFCNLCSDMTKQMFHWVKQESVLAVKFLDNPEINSFQALFITKMPFYHQFDHIVRLQDTAELGTLVEKHGDQKQGLDYLGHVFPQAQRLVLDLLARGLEQRVYYLGVQLPAAQRWAVNEPAPEPNQPITVGLLLNPEFAFSILEKGPGANLPEAFEFRKFWGKKCEVRRFRDGSICEAVVWHSDSVTLQQKRLVCRDVVTYLLEERLGISADVYVADEVETLLQRESVQVDKFDCGTGEEAAMQVIAALDRLCKQVRQVKDIPLDVSSFQGSSPVFRYSEVFPPLATSLHKNRKMEHRQHCLLAKVFGEYARAPDWIPANEAVMQLGLSGKWPQDLAAVRRIKAAFYIKIAEGLREQFSLTTMAFPDHVCVFKDGFVFNLVVAHQREVSLLKETVSPEGVTMYRDTRESIALEKRIIHLPRLTGILHGLHQQFAAFGPTCCLAKRWLSAHLLDAHHFPDMCVELLVMSLFLKPEPFQLPTQPQLGFLRFLQLMGRTDWNSEPVVLNFNSELNREEVLEIENWFHKARVNLPPLFFATPYDRKTSMWSKDAPSLQILIRVAMLARESLRVLEDMLFSTQRDWKVVFRPPMDAYDVIIHLTWGMIPRSTEAVDEVKPRLRIMKPYSKEEDEKIPVVGFNPVQCYLQELRDTYGDYALFFCDLHGGSLIAVVWKPPALLPRSFKVSHVNCHKPTADGSQMQLNTDAIVEDFYTLGHGLVRSVEVRNSR